MSKFLYLDACVLAKLFLFEDHSVEATALLQDEQVVSVLTSDWSYPEVCGVFSRAVAQGRITQAEGEVLQVTFRHWFLTSTTHIAARLEQLLAAGTMALKFGIRGADAMHLVAAVSAQGSAALVDEFVFVTYDRALAAAARKTGVFTSVSS